MLRVHIYINGLQPNLRTLVLAADPTDMPEAKAIAKQHERQQNSYIHASGLGKLPDLLQTISNAEERISKEESPSYCCLQQ